LLQSLLFALKTMLCTGSQKKTTALSCLICFTRPGKTTTPALQVLVYSTILFLTISMDMPSLENRSNCTFRHGFLRLVTKTTSNPGFKHTIGIEVLSEIGLKPDPMAL